MNKKTRFELKTGKLSKGFIAPNQECQERTTAACRLSRTVAKKISQKAKKIDKNRIDRM